MANYYQRRMAKLTEILTRFNHWGSEHWRCRTSPTQEGNNPDRQTKSPLKLSLTMGNEDGKAMTDQRRELA